VGKTADALRYAATGGSTRVEILGSGRLILEGSDGVIDYGPEAVGFRCGRRQIWVKGEDLRLVCLETDSAVLAGRIGEVQFL